LDRDGPIRVSYLNPPYQKTKKVTKGKNQKNRREVRKVGGK